MMKQGLTFTFILGLSACSSSYYAPPPPPTIKPAKHLQIVGGSWVWDSTLDKNPNIEFQSDGRLRGFGGCNRIQGQYDNDTQLKDGRYAFKVSELIMTEMACSPGLSEETHFLDGLQNSRSYSFNLQGSLILFDAAGNETIRMARP